MDCIACTGDAGDVGALVIRATWIDAAKAVPIATVAAALLLDVRPNGKSFGPCPCCGAAHRSNPGRPIDRRGRCRLSADHWACCSNGTDGCGASGDALALVALVLTGDCAWTSGPAGDAIRTWYAGNGWCIAADGQMLPIERRRPIAAPAPEAPPSRPDGAEVAQVWFHARSVADDPEVAAYLRGRGFDPAGIAALDLARALPTAGALPAWAYRRRQSWRDSGHRLIVPLWAPDPGVPGSLQMASLHARCVRACDAGHKAASPQGHSHKGLIMAARADALRDGEARQLLTICEGVPDFIAWALQPATARGGLLGGISGSASAEILALVPSTWAVAVATHADPGGDQQALAWKREIERRGCRYVRCLPSQFAAA